MINFSFLSYAMIMYAAYILRNDQKKGASYGNYTCTLALPN